MYKAWNPCFKSKLFVSLPYHTVHHCSNPVSVLKQTFWVRNRTFGQVLQSRFCTHSAVGLSVPLDEEAGAVPDDHPLQMGRHGEPV